MRSRAQARSSRLTLASLPPEEPDAGNLHVRVCEGASGQPPSILGVVPKRGRSLPDYHPSTFHGTRFI